MLRCESSSPLATGCRKFVVQKQMQAGFNVKRYASGVAKEIINALNGLIEE